MKVKLNVKEINSAKEQAIANYLEFMIDYFMYLLETFQKLEEIDEEENDK